VFLCLCPGLPDFYLLKIPKRAEIYQIDTKLPNGHKLYQMAVIHVLQMTVHRIDRLFSFQGAQKFTQIWILGLKTCHLATLPLSRFLLWAIHFSDFK
jgi:hypothetical protein